MMMNTIIMKDSIDNNEWNLMENNSQLSVQLSSTNTKKYRKRLKDLNVLLQ